MHLLLTRARTQTHPFSPASVLFLLQISSRPLSVLDLIYPRVVTLSSIFCLMCQPLQLHIISCLATSIKVNINFVCV